MGNGPAGAVHLSRVWARPVRSVPACSNRTLHSAWWQIPGGSRGPGFKYRQPDQRGTGERTRGLGGGLAYRMQADR